MGVGLAYYDPLLGRFVSADSIVPSGHIGICFQSRPGGGEPDTEGKDIALAKGYIYVADRNDGLVIFEAIPSK